MSKKTIGVIGGGQLCLMMGEAIKNKSLPFDLISLDPTPDCPAHAFISRQILGSFKDEKGIRELASASDVLTLEIELARAKILSELKDEGKIVRPKGETLHVIQDKLLQAEFFESKGLPTAPSHAVSSKENIESAIAKYGLPIMIKARKGGYDGKGNFVIRSKEQIEEALSYFSGVEIMVQKYIPFDSEISIICVRDDKGNIVTFPISENVHGKDYNVLETSFVPARISEDLREAAKKLGCEVMKAFEDIGTFGVELFVSGGKLYINEVAPRPHNTGHYTIEACESSQFEQHLLAVGGMDLKSTNLTVSGAVMHNILGGQNQQGSYKILYDDKEISGTTQVEEGVYIHHYEKLGVKPYRKLGHVTILAKSDESMSDLIDRSQKVFNRIQVKVSQ